MICDRFADSTLAYQGCGQGADRAMIAALTGLLGIAPDLTLMLDVADDIAAERLKRRATALDRYERQDAQFHQRVNEGFRAIAAAEPERCVTIAAGGTIDEVHAAILAAIGAGQGWPQFP